MNERTDRTWPLPKQPWVMRMTWSELLFAHWPVDPDLVASLLPAGMTLDTRDGKAWIGVVPFLMSNIAPRLCPPIPGLSRFLELERANLRHGGWRAGCMVLLLWMPRADVAVRVARATFNLPYMDATMSINRDDAGAIQYTSRRKHRGEPLAEYEAG